MMQVRQLSKLHGVGRTRKCAVLLERVELRLAGIASGDGGDPEAASVLISYALEMARFLAQASESGPELAEAARLCADALPASADPSLALRAVNDFRHVLMRLSGQAPADWDLHEYHPLPGSLQDGGEAARSFIPGFRVYLEDIRSPFNVGTIMRTAEALGFEEVLLSPACADPRHPRAERSSMGAVDIIPWRRCPLADLSLLGPIFALELGGQALGEFAFPARGVLLLGSEELGVSAAALALAEGGRVSIPMRGIKASINVAVAFGIAAQAWISSP